MTSLVASPVLGISRGFVCCIMSLIPRFGSYLLSLRREPLSLSLWRVYTFCVLCLVALNEPWKPPGEKYSPSSAVSAREAVSCASMWTGPSSDSSVFFTFSRDLTGVASSSLATGERGMTARSGIARIFLLLLLWSSFRRSGLVNECPFLT